MPRQSGRQTQASQGGQPEQRARTARAGVQQYTELRATLSIAYESFACSSWLLLLISSEGIGILIPKEFRIAKVGERNSSVMGSQMTSF
jgi:hypothetical protein